MWFRDFVKRLPGAVQKVFWKSVADVLEEEAEQLEDVMRLASFLQVIFSMGQVWLTRQVVGQVAGPMPSAQPARSRPLVSQRRRGLREGSQPQTEPPGSMESPRAQGIPHPRVPPVASTSALAREVLAGAAGLPECD